MVDSKIDWQPLAEIKGLRLGVAAAGIKYPNRHDVAILSVEEGASVAGVFTQSAFSAAPIQVCREHLSAAKNSADQPRLLVINSGNANACTGPSGLQSALDVCGHLAQVGKVKPEQVLPFSTGVIGEPLDASKITAVLEPALESATEAGWEHVARAIMTTDTRPKGACVTLEADGGEISISGVAKGAGMINPNMATMLAFIATDAAIAPALLDCMCRVAANKSFNRITIDGDTSTNDASMLIATGKAPDFPLLESEDDTRYASVLAGIVEVFESLAQQIVRDGEGATKFVEIKVQGGKSAQESLNVAYAVAHSPLVKTALYASDANWGRIVAAIGYADIEKLDATLVKVWLDDVCVVEQGERASNYRDEDGQKVFEQSEFSIVIDLGRGASEESLWTSDLSHEYIRINAEYRS